MQKKQLLQFAVLLVLILVLAGTYVGVQSYQTRQEDEKNKKEAAAVVTLTSFEPDSVTAICYDMDGIQYTFEKDSEGWKDVSDSEITLDQDAFEDFLQKAGSITSDNEVQVQEGEDYGFSEPLRTVSITTANGTSSLIFGMKNEMLDQYYMKTSESSKIYLVEESVYTMFDQTTEDFKKEEIQTNTDTETDIE